MKEKEYREFIDKILTWHTVAIIFLAINCILLAIK